MKSGLGQLQERYELELDRIVKEVKNKNVEVVLIQLPDGLKMFGPEIVDWLESKCEGVDFKIWAGSCFGACDVPETNADLIVQFGHGAWDYRKDLKVL